MGNHNSALIADIEDFDSIESVTGRLRELATHVGDERLHSQFITLVSQSKVNSKLIPTMQDEKQGNGGQPEKVTGLISLNPQENTQTKSENTSLSTSTTASTSYSLTPHGAYASTAHPFSPLMLGVFSAVLHATLPPHIPSNKKPERQPGAQHAVTLEELQTELSNLKDEMELMKNQHNKEIKLLMSELDEEKKIRLSLQVDIQRMKKKMSK